MTNRVVAFAAMLAPRYLVLAVALGCGASAEERSIDPQLVPDEVSVSEPEPLGSLSVALTYAKAEIGAAVVSVWPRVTDAGGICPLDCARQVAACPPDCDFVAIGTNESTSWPGTNTVLVTDLQPRSYWVSAYLMRGADHRDGPRRLDPVSRKSPVHVEVVSQRMAYTSLSLDAVRADPSVADTSACPLPSRGVAAFGQLEVETRRQPDVVSPGSPQRWPRCP